jgi:hypothetical protein
VRVAERWFGIARSTWASSASADVRRPLPQRRTFGPRAQARSPRGLGPRDRAAARRSWPSCSSGRSSPWYWRWSLGGLHRFDGGGPPARCRRRRDAEGFASLRIEDYPPEELSGYEAPESLITALPSDGYDLAGYRVEPVVPTRVVEEGDVLDLGDRRFSVLHLPGHTPGEIGLWDEETQTLFPGDCVYESGILLDELPESSIPDYVRSMERLRDLPVRAVHGGHDESFGRERLLELVDAYVERRGSLA